LFVNQLVDAFYNHRASEFLDDTLVVGLRYEPLVAKGSVGKNRFLFVKIRDYVTRMLG